MQGFAAYKSVISSIANFWNQAFILPMACLDTIESFCSVFLWSGDPHQTHKTKVRWKNCVIQSQMGDLVLAHLHSHYIIYCEMKCEIEQWKNIKKSLFHLWSKHFFVSSLLYFLLHFAVNYEVELKTLLGDFVIMSESLHLIWYSAYLICQTLSGFRGFNIISYVIPGCAWWIYMIMDMEKTP